MAAPKIWRRIPEAYSLTGRKCSKCAALFFPQREVCSSCGSQDMQSHRFKGKGKIATYTIIRTPVADPEGELNEVSFRNIPYVLAIITLEEGPSLTAEIVDCNPDDVEIGKKVGMVFRKIVQKGEKGVIQYGYKFRLE